MILGQMFNIPEDGIALMLIPIILIAIIAGAIEMRRKEKYNAMWITGEEYKEGIDDNRFPWRSEWGIKHLEQIGRLKSDPDKEEFIVFYNLDDGYFYDKNDIGYLASELYIKKETPWEK